MPDFDAFAKSYGLVVAVFSVATLGLTRAVVLLYQENAKLHEHLETLLDERNKAVEQLVDNAIRDRRPPS